MGGKRKGGDWRDGAGQKPDNTTLYFFLLGWGEERDSERGVHNSRQARGRCPAGVVMV